MALRQPVCPGGESRYSSLTSYSASEPRPLDASHVAWLVGSGRSGTTWLAGLLATARGTVQVFEPLHPGRAPLPVRLDPPLMAGGRPYLRPGRRAPTWEALMDDIRGGVVGNRWTRFGHHRRTRWPSLWWSGVRADSRLVKEIRANLLIGWLAEAGRTRSALMLRHPCATVVSQERGGWGADLTPFLCDRDLVEDWLGPHVDWLRSLGTHRERLAARWAIENVVPLRQAAGGLPIAVVHYEDVVSDPVRATERLGAHLGIEPDATVLRRVIGRPVGLRSGSSGVSSVSSWREKLAGREVQKILDVCWRIGITRYEESPLPVDRSTDSAS